MIDKQDELRNKVKELKWKDDVSYKEMANMLDMRYNSFVNFVHGYKGLGYGRSVKLQQMIDERRGMNG